MATNVTKNIYRTRKVYNNKLGKMIKQKVKVGEKVKNTTKGSNIGLIGNKAKLESQRISEAAGVKKAQIANKATVMSEAIAGATSTALKALDRGRTQSSEVREITKGDSGVAQAINGGATSAFNQRNDDEEEDNPMIA